MDPRPFDEQQLLGDAPLAGRTCGDCTVCCTLLSVAELQKPMRCACEHVGQQGCRFYPDRPGVCRQFHCLWLRGALPESVEYRPDRLGVMFDAFRTSPSGELRLVALEAWNGAFQSPAARSVMDHVAAKRELQLSNRDGDWATAGPAARQASGRSGAVDAG